jgi:16S rRNA processing protein RimM
MAAEPVVVGLVGKPFGIRGDVYVHPDVDLDHDFPPGTVYEVHGRRLVVAFSRIHGGRQLVRFEGVDDRETAESLRGSVLRVDRSAVTLGEDAFWTRDLVGREVVDDAGEIIGVVEAFADGPAHDYLVIARPDGGEVMVPAVEELVRIDPDRITVVPLPGLLDPE